MSFIDIDSPFGSKPADPLGPDRRRRVRELLDQGKSWEQIGREIGWEPQTLRLHYEADHG